MDIIYYNEPMNNKFVIEAGNTLHEFDTKEEQKEKYFELTKVSYRVRNNNYTDDILEHISAIRSIFRRSIAADIKEEEYYENIINKLGDLVDDIEDYLVEQI